MNNLQGKWKVIYKIEHPEKEEFKDKEFSFEIDVINNEGDISGNFKEFINDKIIENSISGFIEDNILSFTRLYYPFHIIQNAENVEYNNEESLSEMEFTGEYDPNLNEFNGEWHLVLNVIQKGYFYFEEGYSGTWKMTKV